MSYKNSSLWKSAFEKGDAASADARRRLEAAFELFRERAGSLAAEVATALPGLTDHSIVHLDALWEMASIVAGGEATLNPAEAFVLGGALLLHDLGNAVAAYPNHLKDLQDETWNDLVVATYLQEFGRRPTEDEKLRLPEDVHRAVLLSRLRESHAQQAEKLATLGFFSRSGGSRIFLIDDRDIRDSLGPLIGKIAHSHHWDTSRVEATFASPVGTPTFLPRDWTLDRLRIALLLRVADATHLDERRAPSLQMAVRQISASSLEHWKFQNLLFRPNSVGDSLVFTSKRPFDRSERDSWWLCRETLGWVDRELRLASRSLVASGRPPFAIREVRGSDSPEHLAKYIETLDWKPVDVRIHVSNVAQVVRRFGGKELYGATPLAPLRELIANAADSIRARRARESRPDDWGEITVSVGADAKGWWLEVGDNGLGMSEAVMTGPLLDFGTTYWTSALARREHPGLLASKFSPTGKFGIGFFSVFMLGDQVRVVTRLHTEGVTGTRVLDVSLSSRPILRSPGSADSGEAMQDAGSRVRVWLNDDPFTSAGMLGSPGTEAPINWLKARVAQVAASLDVTVRVTRADMSVVALVANDWESIPFDSLVARTGAKGRFDSKIGGPEILVRRDGRLVGRFKLTGRTYGGGGTLTVGGLSTLQHLNLFQGVLLADTPTLDRGGGKALADSADLSLALRGVEAQFPVNGYSFSQAARIAATMLNAGVRPTRLTPFLFDGRRANSAELVVELEDVEEGAELILALSDSAKMEIHHEDISVELDEVDDWTQNEAHILVAPLSDESHYESSAIGELCPGFPSPRDPLLGMGRIGTQPFPNSIAAYALELMAEAWGVSATDLVDDASVDELSIVVDSETVLIPAITFTRPRLSEE